MPNKPIKRILKIIALTFASILLLVLVCLALLPTVVNSQTAQNKIKHIASTSMKRTVVWSSFSLSWFNGLKLDGLKLGDGAAPLLKTDIDQIIVAPSVGRGTDGRFGIDLVVKVVNIRAELAPGPPKPPPPPSLKDPLTLLAESIQKVQGLDFPLPVDVRVLLEVAPLNLTYRAVAPAKHLQLQDFSFRFAMPSLAAKPITAAVNGRIFVDQRELGNVGLNAKISDLVTAAQRIHLASALVALDAAAPGTSIVFSGGLSQADGFKAQWKVDLPELLKMAQPFVPPKTPKLSGKISMELRAKADSQRDLRATVTLDVTNFAASGGSLKAKQVGPLDLKLQQKITTDHVKQRVDFPGGKFTVPGVIDAAWSASVDRPTVPERSVDLTFGPLQIDLARTIFLARPFLPPDSPVKYLAGEAFLRSLKVKLTGPANNGTVALSGMGVKLPKVRLAQKKGELNVENIDLLLEKLECPLVAKQPTRVVADLLWSVKRVGLSGAEPLSLQGLHGTIGLTVNDLNLKSASPRKVSAAVTVTQRFDMERATLGTKLIINKAHEQLRLLARATERGDIEASLPELVVSAASVQATQGGKKVAPLPFSASLTADGLLLPVEKVAKPSLKSAVAAVSAGDFLQMAAEAALSNSSPQRATSKGSVRLDLRRAMPFAAPFAPAGLKADGVVSALWDIAAPLPEKAFVADKHPLKGAKAGLALLDKLDVGLKLDGIAATLPSAKGAIKITGLQTKPDLRITVTKNGESARLEGGILFSGVSGLPGAGGKLPEQQGKFLLNGELSRWKEFRLTEEFHIKPLGISHEADLNVSRIDTLFDEKQPFSTATMIKRLDATLFATLDAMFSRELKQLLPGFDVAGNFTSSARVDLVAGRELALRCAVKTNEFGVQLANGTKVEGMRSDIAINRVYNLAAEQGERWTPLSAALVRPISVRSANPGAAEIVGRINDDLRGDVRGARSFSIRRVTVKPSSGVPLVLTSLEGDLLFTQENTGLSFFQADLLGGTVLARAVFDLLPYVPTIAAGSSFSNLDITQLLPQDVKKRQTDQDAEITGEMNLAAPLTAEQRELFEQLRLAANVRKIGANTLERALFSLDPYERNEQVVAQRKMLRLGSLKGLRATAVDGAFSMEGEAQVKGVALELPKVERLRISELPLRQELIKNKAAITALRSTLDLVRADTLVVGTKGELSLKRRKYEK
jgi:hypothetical protein